MLCVTLLSIVSYLCLSVYLDSIDKTSNLLGRTLFVNAFFSPDKDNTFPKHQKTDRNRFLGAVETHLKSNKFSTQGPYILGKAVSYADLVLYQICHDESLTQDGRKGLKEYPRLTKLVDAVEARPNIKAFLQSDRYLG